MTTLKIGDTVRVNDNSYGVKLVLDQFFTPIKNEHVWLTQIKSLEVVDTSVRIPISKLGLFPGEAVHLYNGDCQISSTDYLDVMLRDSDGNLYCTRQVSCVVIPTC